MNIFKKLKIKKCLKQIEPDVDKRLIELGLLKIVNGKKEYAFGSVNTKWQIQKELLKEGFNIDWQTPQDKNSNINFD